MATNTKKHRKNSSAKEPFKGIALYGFDSESPRGNAVRAVAEHQGLRVRFITRTHADVLVGSIANLQGFRPGQKLPGQGTRALAQAEAMTPVTIKAEDKLEDTARIDTIDTEITPNADVISACEIAQDNNAEGMREIARDNNAEGMRESARDGNIKSARETAWDGEFMLICGLSPDEMNALLNAQKEAGCAIACKAVLTAYNKMWPLGKLIAEIVTEHESLSR